MPTLDLTYGIGDFKIRSGRPTLNSLRLKYEEQGFTLEKAMHFAANDELPYLSKRLRQEYAQFLIDFYELQEDPIQQQILEWAITIRNRHDMNQTDSIRQAIKLRKDLFLDISWAQRNTVVT